MMHLYHVRQMEMQSQCHVDRLRLRSQNTHSLTAALDQLRVVASSTSNDPGPRSRQHQQIGQRLLPLAAANFSVDDPAGASSQQREECRCGLLLTVEVPAKQVCSPVGDRCDVIIRQSVKHRRTSDSKCPPTISAETMSRYGQLMTCSGA